MAYTDRRVEFRNSKGQVVGRVGPTYLYAEEAARAILRHNHPQPVTALAVMRVESLLSPDAEGDLTRVGEHTADGRHWDASISLMQIRSIREEYGKGTARDARALKDVDFNLRQAVALFKEEGWRPWVAYTSGRYREHLPWAEDTFRQLEGENVARSVKSLLKLKAEIRPSRTTSTPSSPLTPSITIPTGYSPSTASLFPRSAGTKPTSTSPGTRTVAGIDGCD